MTKKQKFKTLRERGEVLVNIAQLLPLSLRQAKRYNKSLKDGTLLNKHGLRNKPSNYKSSIDKQAIWKEYMDLNTIVTRDRCADPITFELFITKYCTHKCSLSTFKNIAKDNLYASPWARKTTIKKYKMLLKEQLKGRLDKQKEKEIIDLISSNERHYYRLPRPDNIGEIHEIDACKDYWFNDQYCYLHATIDPANGNLIAGHFEKEETTHGYFKVLESQINRGLLPELFKGDCRSSFVINKKDAGALAYKDVNTQFGFVLNTLGIKMENSSEPTFKGHIERSFRTIQSHLKTMFRIEGIDTYEQANKYFNDIYIPYFNTKFGIKPKLTENKHLIKKLSQEEINDLLSIREFRKTDKANAIFYKNGVYSLYNTNHERLNFNERSPILVMENLDGTLKAQYHENEIILKPIEEKYLTSSQREQYRNGKRLTPSFSLVDHHPWGYRIFALYLDQTKNLTRYLAK